MLDRVFGLLRWDGSPMPRPLVTIRDAYRDQQGRSKYGRAGKVYKVWMHARGVLVCSGADRMCRPLRVRFIPDGTTFQEEPTHRDGRATPLLQVGPPIANPHNPICSDLSTSQARLCERELAAGMNSPGECWPPKRASRSPTPGLSSGSPTLEQFSKRMDPWLRRAEPQPFCTH
jgi:hypothetical protein